MASTSAPLYWLRSQPVGASHVCRLLLATDAAWLPLNGFSRFRRRTIYLARWSMRWRHAEMFDTKLILPQSKLVLLIDVRGFIGGVPWKVWTLFVIQKWVLKKDQRRIEVMLSHFKRFSVLWKGNQGQSEDCIETIRWWTRLVVCRWCEWSRSTELSWFERVSALWICSSDILPRHRLKVLLFSI